MNKNKWIEYALSQGMESVEIYQSLTTQKEITWFSGQMDTFVSSHVLGTMIRGIVDGNMASMALEDTDDDKMEEVISSLIKQAKTVTTKEQDSLRKPEQTEEVVKEKEFVKPSMDQIKQTLELIEKKCLAYDPRVSQVSYLSFEEATGTREITNSYGVQVYDEDKMNAIGCSVAVSQNDEIKDDALVKVVYDLEKFDVDAYVKELCDKALSKLNATSLKSGSYPVIFEKDAMTSLFASFVGLFSGDLIFKGISPLKGKENTKIFSDKITIIDNPRNLEALTIANYDDEGCPTKEKVLVDKGVFSSMLHDTKSALRMHTESTGNGFKSGYASNVGVSPMNCYIQPGEKSLDELCEDMQEGLVITELAGLHAGIDFVTTNFSLQCSGYYVKNGKCDHSVSLITVAGNFLEMMNDVKAVANDLQWEYKQIVTPSIAFNACAISGE